MGTPPYWTNRERAHFKDLHFQQKFENRVAPPSPQGANDSPNSNEFRLATESVLEPDVSAKHLQIQVV